MFVQFSGLLTLYVGLYEPVNLAQVSSFWFSAVIEDFLWSFKHIIRLCIVTAVNQVQNIESF